MSYNPNNDGPNGPLNDGKRGKTELEMEIPTSQVASNQSCSNCGTNRTPLWRRAPDGTLICNACGLYYRSNNTHRPVNLKKTPNIILVEKGNEGSCSGDGRCNGTGGSAACNGCPAYNNRLSLLHKKNEGSEKPSCKNDPEKPKESEQKDNDSLAIACFNCNTTITPLWRRDDVGNTICNACGLYFKLHGSHRPIKMKKTTIKRRKRNIPEVSVTPDPNSLSAENKVGHEGNSVSPINNIDNKRDTLLHTSPSPIPNESMRKQPPEIAPIKSIPVANPYPFPGLAQHHFPPYNGSGRVPNGPGPLPGPPPPSLYHQYSNYSLPLPHNIASPPHQPPYQQKPAALDPISKTLPKPNVGPSLPLPYSRDQNINLPSINLSKVAGPHDSNFQLKSPEKSDEARSEVSEVSSNTVSFRGEHLGSEKMYTSRPVEPKQEPSEEIKLRRPLAVDFTTCSNDKYNQISIPGLLNK